jgi:hypothetical protein
MPDSPDPVEQSRRHSEGDDQYQPAVGCVVQRLWRLLPPGQGQSEQAQKTSSQANDAEVRYFTKLWVKCAITTGLLDLGPTGITRISGTALLSMAMVADALLTVIARRITRAVSLVIGDSSQRNWSGSQISFLV